MALGLTAIRSAIETQLTAQTTNVRVYGRSPGQVQPPAVLVNTAADYVTRDVTMQRGHATVRFDLLLMVRKSALDSAQRELDALIDTVVDAVLADRTLGGAVLDVQMPTVGGHQEADMGNNEMLVAQIELETVVRDDGS